MDRSWGPGAAVGAARQPNGRLEAANGRTAVNSDQARAVVRVGAGGGAAAEGAPREMSTPIVIQIPEDGRLYAIALGED